MEIVVNAVEGVEGPAVGPAVDAAGVEGSDPGPAVETNRVLGRRARVQRRWLAPVDAAQVVGAVGCAACYALYFPIFLAQAFLFLTHPLDIDMGGRTKNGWWR